MTASTHDVTRTREQRRIIQPIWALLLVAACGGPSAGSSAETSEADAGATSVPVAPAAGPGVDASGPTAAAPSAKLVWKEDLGAEHIVNFYEQASGGGWIVGEEGTIQTAPLVTHELASSRLREIFGAVRPGAPLPEALAALESHEPAPLRKDIAPPAPLPAGTPSHGQGTAARSRGIVSETAGDDNAFMLQHCQGCNNFGNEECVCDSGYDWMQTGATIGWDNDGWTSFGGLGSEATTSTTYGVFGYLCYPGGFLNLGWNCGWQTLASTTMAPGKWYGWTGNTGTAFSQFEGSINQVLFTPSPGPNDHATVDMVLNYTYNEYWVGTCPAPSCSGNACSYARP